MSYILDALRKSEQARQQNTAAQQYSLLPGVDEQIVVRRSWPYVLAVALLVNAAVFYLWLRPMPRGRHACDQRVGGGAHAESAGGEKGGIFAPVSPRDKPAVDGGEQCA